ncbi:MAG TPA: helix-turn-helix domain-containing protein [Rhizomicrobium sp.]|jgi:DNA-binding HxlR family transcriptional regulator|nr:helix-turn-helix domain-containing protein [Rhizomicrobium sp.]
MRWDALSREDCSLSKTLAAIGDRWTLLILREAFLRVRRFEAFEANLKIARRVLSERLALLVEEGILRKVPYQERPVRQEYRLTRKGLDLYPAILSLVHWGDKHYPSKNGPPVLHTHLACGHDFRAMLSCSECGEAVDARGVAARPGKGRKARVAATP